MVTALPRYDELYVISDLHMGGRPGFQIFREGRRLARLIRHLAAVRPDEDVALVLNGDIIDSLAENLEGYIAIAEAASMMDRIFGDPAFAPVWEALAQFVATPRRKLVVVLGNHDLELALPHVEHSIRTRLADGDPAAEGRILFATRGAGYACRVGKARVLCTHGNEVDEWNLVDHDLLAQLGSAVNAGRAVEPASFTPNAGTRLVVDVMNAIKARYPFVDLLKPETKAVTPVLLVLEPELASRILDVLPLAGEWVGGALRRRKLLSNSEGNGESIQELLGPSLGGSLSPATGRSPGGSALLAEVEQDVAAGRRPSEAAPLSSGETLGWTRMALDRLLGVGRVEALRRALQDWLKDDRSFAIDERDETFRRVSARAGKEVDFIVAGHTHLERAIRVEPGIDRFYYNSGTWARLLRLTPAVLKDPELFSTVFGAMSTGRMEDLDEATIPSSDGAREPLILTRSTVVRIASGPDGVSGALCHAIDSRGDAVDLEVVEGSEFRRR